LDFWEQITKLLHVAFVEHATCGLTYATCNQTVEQTINCAKGIICFVAIADGKLARTACVRIDGKIMQHIGGECHFAQHMHPKFKVWE